MKIYRQAPGTPHIHREMITYREDRSRLHLTLNGVFSMIRILTLKNMHPRWFNRDTAPIYVEVRLMPEELLDARCEVRSLRVYYLDTGTLPPSTVLDYRRGIRSDYTCRVPEDLDTSRGFETTKVRIPIHKVTVADDLPVASDIYGIIKASRKRWITMYRQVDRRARQLAVEIEKTVERAVKKYGKEEE